MNLLPVQEEEVPESSLDPSRRSPVYLPSPSLRPLRDTIMKSKHLLLFTNTRLGGRGWGEVRRKGREQGQTRVCVCVLELGGTRSSPDRTSDVGKTGTTTYTEGQLPSEPFSNRTPVTNRPGPLLRLRGL